MHPHEFERNETGTGFVAAAPKSAHKEASTTTARLASFGTYRVARPRVLDSTTTDFRALAFVIVAAIALAVIPEVITHLVVKHSPDLPPLEETAASDVPLAHLVRFAGSAVFLLMSSAIVLMRGHQNRNITGVLLLLSAVNLPYLISPVLPGMGDLVKVVLANAVILALWNIGAPVAGLKWVPMTVALISVYSIVGGLVIPEYMMYQEKSEKAIIAGWELAGPFGHGNVLGLYCVLSFALVPLIISVRWRLLTGSLLFAPILLSASRTAVIGAGLVLLWWMICWFRSVISVRLAGTVFVGLIATAMLVVPFMNWDPHAFTDRASVWTASISAWQQSPLVGLGVNWFLTDAQSSANVASWAYVGTGHNLVIDTLVKSGLLGLGVLACVLLAAVGSTRALRVTNQQIACFGYLIAFFGAATTEATWALVPNVQLFPISGLIFAVLIVARHRDSAKEGPS